MSIGAAPRGGTIQRWTLAVPGVSADLILRLQKYRDPAQAPPAVREIAGTVAGEAARLAAAEAVLWRGAVTHVEADGRVELAGAHRFQSRLLARHLAGAAHAYVLVLTLGPAIEERAQAMLAERLLVEGFLMDTAAWAALVVLGRLVRRRLLAAERPEGRTVTHRMAPGFGDWPVADQPALLRVFGDAPLPVRVTEVAWMVPSKSVSGVYGVVAAG